ncbi:hypothetical protein LSUE1_G002455 [Lachnellula suecica]|uniref:DUF6594 domain-containing protein n=1 Tax=Lachnellula suecica TaxID=602035 RepID=A0A8T9CE42_9HELO|nr:hypothetical protein LSUE1_G002455 [Lachnellula suecica]
MSNTSTPSIALGSLSSTIPTSPPATSRVSTSTRNSASTTSTEQPTNEEIERKPWKYIGYKGYADILSSDSDFCIFRKFLSLNCRVALSLQDQVSALEEELDSLDKHYSKKSTEDTNNGSFRDDREDRTELVEKIHTKLAQYKEANLPSYDQDLIFSISDKRIDRFITFLILGVGTAMLITPIWILEVMVNPTRKLAVITVFIVAFLAMLSSVTVAKPFETLAATAAYSAVLMVFLQLGNAGGP